MFRESNGGMNTMIRFSARWHALVLACLVRSAAMGAVVYTEDFSGGANGWGDRDAGEMGVSHQGSVGSPASAAMQGLFGASVLPQTDAFTINSGANFVGNYTTYGAGLTQIKFDLYADNVLPSDLFIRIINGSDTFSYQYSLASLALDTWTTFTVDLDFTTGWSGPSLAAFNAALTSVDQLDIQLTRNGNSSQLFYLDNVQTLDTPLNGGGGGGGGSVPEPGSGILVMCFAALLYGRTRKQIR